MFFSGARLCFLLAAVSRCCAAVLADEPRTITAHVNETIVLPCNITVKGDLPTVEWSKEGLTPNITFLYRSGCETFEEKNPEFHHRTNLVLNELKDGNLSQIIYNLRLSDAGRYQCRTLRGRQWQVESTVDLVVAAVSEPKLTVVLSSDEVWLQCKAECWSSMPTVQFLDDQGNEIEAPSSKLDTMPTGYFTVTRRATLQAATNRVKCRVSQKNETREAEIFIPDHWVRGCTKSFVIVAVGTLLLTCLLWIFGVWCCWKWGHVVSPCSSKPLPNPNKKIKELERKNEELKKSLSEKNQLIHNLELKSKSTSASQSNQSTHGSRSSLNGSKQSTKLHQGNTQKPGPPSTSHHPQPDIKSEVKESKPAAPKQNPTSVAQKKPDRPKSLSAPSTNDGAVSRGTELHRSMSLSPRRFTMPNRFSVLENLPEESRSLIEN